MQAIQSGRLFVPRRPSAAPASAPPPRPKSPSITTHITKNSNDPAHVDLTSHRRGPNPRVPITSTMKLLSSIHEALTCEPFPILIFPTLLVSPPTPLLLRHGHAMNPNHELTFEDCVLCIPNCIPPAWLHPWPLYLETQFPATGLPMPND
jgi:hypothetical protein